jgi:hypothetical protein
VPCPALQATPFIDLFQDYARSHMWYGAQLLIMLVVALSCGLVAAPLLLWSNILAILALLAAPFWFNPFTFDWQKNKVRDDKLNSSKHDAYTV